RERNADLVAVDLERDMLVPKCVADANPLLKPLVRIELLGETEDYRLLRLALDGDDAHTVVIEDGAVGEVHAPLEVDCNVRARVGAPAQAALRGVSRVDDEPLDVSPRKSGVGRLPEDLADEKHHFLRSGGARPISAERAARQAVSRTLVRSWSRSYAKASPRAKRPGAIVSVPKNAASSVSSM